MTSDAPMDEDMEMEVQHVSNTNTHTQTHTNGEVADPSTNTTAIEPPFSDQELEKNRIWRKNCGYLYDSIIYKAIPWPSLTIEWLPDVVGDPYDSQVTTQRLIAGTRTCQNGDELLRIFSVKREPITIDNNKIGFNSKLKEFGKYTSKTKNGIEVTQRLNHSAGEINRARYMPQNPNLIATCCSNGKIYIFDRSKHPSEPSEKFQPDIIMDHHRQEGFGLAFNRLKRGYLLTAAEEVVLWDLNRYTNTDKSINPLKVIKDHTDLVNEVDWNPHNEHMFISASDDNNLFMYDLRSNEGPSSKTAYTSSLNCCKYSPGNENLIATGSSDSTIQLWDSRQFDKPFQILEGHSDVITTLHWNPNEQGILATGSVDKTVVVWDICSEPSSSSSSMLFKHGGHKSEVNDLSWNPANTWEIASVASDNSLQVWQIATSIISSSLS